MPVCTQCILRGPSDRIWTGVDDFLPAVAALARALTSCWLFPYAHTFRLCRYHLVIMAATAAVVVSIVYILITIQHIYFLYPDILGFLITNMLLLSAVSVSIVVVVAVVVVVVAVIVVAVIVNDCPRRHHHRHHHHQPKATYPIGHMHPRVIARVLTAIVTTVPLDL